MRDVTVIEPSWLLELPDTDSNCSTSVTITKPAKSSDYGEKLAQQWRRQN